MRTPTLTVTEAARLCGLSRQRILRLITKGRIKVITMDMSFPRGRYILDRKSVEKIRDERNGK